MRLVMGIGGASIAWLTASCVLAQGMPGSTVGLTATGLPANPFASNYPSEPPQARPGRPGTAARQRSRLHRGTAARRAEDRLRPPAGIPGRRPVR